MPALYRALAAEATVAALPATVLQVGAPAHGPAAQAHDPASPARGPASPVRRRRVGPLGVASAGFLGAAILVLLVVPHWGGGPSVPGVGARAATPPAAAARPEAPAATPRTSTPTPRAPRLAAWHVQLPNQPAAAPIDREGLSADGFVGVPADVHRVGWFTGAGPIDGVAGSVVLVGHVNWVGQGTGYLGVIKQLPVGARVLTRGAGETTAWRVTDVHEYSKAAGLPQTLFAASGARRLVLITCGGTINSSTGSYDDNVVVTAVPAAG